MAEVLRADHVGSLTRPKKLLDAREACQAGQISQKELQQEEDAAILNALELQTRVGMPILTDGELRRDAWQTGISAAVEGFVDEYPIVESKRPDGTSERLEMHTKAVKGKLRQVRRVTGQEVAFLKKHASSPFKITMPSPSFLARSAYQPGLTDKAYPTPEELHNDLVEIIRQEMQVLAGESVTYIQLDLGFTTYAISAWRQALQTSGINPDKALEEDIAADNACYDILPEGVIRAMHLCRGNRTSYVDQSGGLDWMAERLFNELHVDRYLLEYDDPERAGNFEPLRFLPKHKIAVLGVVSTKTVDLETQDYLLRRIDEAAKFCSIEQLALSPQCGFDGGAHMAEDEVRRKLELVVTTADKVWG